MGLDPFGTESIYIYCSKTLMEPQAYIYNACETLVTTVKPYLRDRIVSHAKLHAVNIVAQSISQ